LKHVSNNLVSKDVRNKLESGLTYVSTNLEIIRGLVTKFKLSTSFRLVDKF